MDHKIDYRIGIQADNSKAKMSLNELKQQLLSIENTGISSLGINKQIQAAAQSAKVLRTNLDLAFNASTGTLDLSKFQSGLKNSKTDIKQLSKNLMGAGREGVQAFTQLTTAMTQAEAPVKNINKLTDELWLTLKNTARWTISSSILNGFIGSIEKAWSYSKKLNKTLNDINIVSDEINTSADTEEFAKKANQAAKDLSVGTNQYAKASLTFFQQGNDMAESMSKASIATKMSNVAFTATADEMSDYLTAIWNAFDAEDGDLEHYADVITKLGAITASSTEEIATSLGKVASTASTVGVSYENLSSIIATVSDNTRQSAETIGVSFKTIFARIDNLKLGKTLEDNLDLGTYSEQLKKAGVDVLDNAGNLKEMDVILNELHDSWINMSRGQKTAIAQVVGGTRQYTYVMSLMENWEEYKKNLDAAMNSEGSLQEQQDIYAGSWEAASYRIQAALEGIYSKVIDDQSVIKAMNNVAEFIQYSDNLIDSLGGVKTILLSISAVLANKFSSQIASGLANVVHNIKVDLGITKSGYQKTLGDLNQYLTGAVNGQAKLNANQKAQLEGLNRILALKIELASLEGNMTKEEQARAKALIQHQQIMETDLNQKREELEIIKKLAIEEAKKGIRRENRKATPSEIVEKNKSYVSIDDKQYNVKEAMDLNIRNRVAYNQSELAVMKAADAQQTLSAAKTEKDQVRKNELLNEYKARLLEIIDLNKETNQVWDGQNEEVNEINKSLEAQISTLDNLVISSKNYQKNLEGVGDNLARTTLQVNKKITKRDENITDQIDKGAGEYITTAVFEQEEYEKLQKVAEENANQSIGTNQKLSQSFANVATGATQAWMGISMLISLPDIWSNNDLTDSEKMVQTMSNLAFTLPMVVTGFIGVGKAISGMITAGTIASFGKITAVIAGIAGVSALLYMNANKASIAVKGLNKALDGLKETTEAISDNSSQIETNLNEINDIYTNTDLLSQTDKDRINDLRKQNDQLQLQNELLKIQQEQEKNKAVQKATKVLSNKGYDIGYDENYRKKKGTVTEAIDYSKGQQEKNINDYNETIKKFNAKQKELSEAKADGKPEAEIELLEKEKNNLLKAINLRNEVMLKGKEELVKLFTDEETALNALIANSTDDEQIANALQEKQRLIQDKLNAGLKVGESREYADYLTKSLESINAEQFSAANQEIISSLKEVTEAYANGKSSVEEYATGVDNALKDIDFKDLKDSSEEVINLVGNTFYDVILNLQAGVSSGKLSVSDVNSSIAEMSDKLGSYFDALGKNGDTAAKEISTSAKKSLKVIESIDGAYKKYSKNSIKYMKSSLDEAGGLDEERLEEDLKGNDERAKSAKRLADESLAVYTTLGANTKKSLEDSWDAVYNKGKSVSEQLTLQVALSSKNAEIQAKAVAVTAEGIAKEAATNIVNIISSLVNAIDIKLKLGFEDGAFVIKGKAQVDEKQLESVKQSIENSLASFISLKESQPTGQPTGQPTVKQPATTTPGGGKGTGSNKSAAKHVEHLTERYHNLTRELEKYDRILDRLDKTADRLYGKDKIVSINNQINALKRQTNALKNYQNEAKRYLLNDKKITTRKAKDYGIKLEYNENGTITNYNKALEKAMKKTNAIIDKYNASKTKSNEKAKDKAIEYYKSLEAAMKKYEESYNKYQEAKDKVTDNIDKRSELELEKLQYKIEYQIKENDLLSKQIDYQEKLLELQDYGTGAKSLQNTINQVAILEKNLKIYQNAIDKARSNKKLNKEQKQDIIQENKENILSAKSDIIDLTKTVQDSFRNAIKESAEQLEIFIKLFDNVNSKLNHYQKLLSYTSDYDNYEALNRILETQNKNLENSISSQKQYLEVLKSQKTAMIARGETDQKNLDAINEAIVNAEDKMYSSTETLLENLKNLYDNKVSSIIKNIEDKFTQGMGINALKSNYSRYQKEQELYLALATKIYSLDKMQNDLGKDISSNVSKAAKERLNALKLEISLLQKKEKISQYELEYAQAQYNLALKTIALEEAQNNKTQMRLTRKGDGSWSYTYAADQGQLDKAKDEYLDALNSTYELSKKAIADYENKVLEMYANMNSDIKALNPKDFASEEEYMAAAKKITESYQKQFAALSSIYETAKKNLAKNAYDLVKESGGTEEEALKAQNQAYNKEISDMLDKFTSGDFNNITAEMLRQMQEAYNQYSGDVSGALSGVGSSLGQIDGSLKDVLNSSNNMGNYISGTLIPVINNEITSVYNGMKAFTDNTSSLLSNIEALKTNSTETENSTKENKKQEEQIKNTTKALVGKTGLIAALKKAEEELVIYRKQASKFTSSVTAQRDMVNSLKDSINALRSKTITITTVHTSVSGAVAKKPSSKTKAFNGGGFGVKSLYNSLPKYDTGGYTGTFGAEGREAILHEKELVLNQKDTTNFLSAIKLMRSLGNETIQKISNAFNNKTITPANNISLNKIDKASTVDNNKAMVEQNIEIKADFPNVNNAEEIKTAFNSLVNEASQYVNRYNK